MEEIWKDIEGFEGLYQVSNLGNVKRLKSKGCVSDRLIAKSINKYGYIYRGLHNKGIYRKFKEHRLVAKSFIDNPENKPTINHINGIKTDNRVENLEWCTHLENKQHAVNSGLTNTKGIKHYFCKLSEEQVLEIREIGFSKSIAYLSRKYGVGKTNISKILKREIWKHI
jgi:hypothetical protein